MGESDGESLEKLDYVLYSKFGVDFMTLPVPRIMGLLRQLRIESEDMEVELRRGRGGVK